MRGATVDSAITMSLVYLVVIVVQTTTTSRAIAVQPERHTLEVAFSLDLINRLCALDIGDNCTSYRIGHFVETDGAVVAVAVTRGG